MNTRKEYARFQADRIADAVLRHVNVRDEAPPDEVPNLILAALTAQAEASGEACLAEHVVGQDYPLAALDAAPQIPEEG